MDKVLINNTPVAAEGLESFSPEYGFDEDSATYTYSIGTALTVRGDDAKELIETFFSGDCEGQKRSLPLRIYKECCDLWFDYTIKYEGTTYCPADCSVEFTPVRITDTTACFQYLNDTIFWKRGFIDAYDHPQVWYCNQPGFVQKVLFLIAPLIVAILAVIDRIVEVIDNICDGIAGIFGGDCNIELPEYLQPCRFIQTLNGCGKKSPSPLIREILEYHCAQCGLTFQSSVFQNTVYRNMVLFQLQYERGRFNPVNWINGNGANLTVIQILDSLDFMNLDYKIVEGKLIVERKDYFNALRENIADVAGLDYCVSFRDDNACAYGRYSYTDDALDQEANKLITYTDDIIEFNPEAADWKRGACTVSAPYGRARFMYDHITATNDDLFFSDYAIDAIRSGNVAINFFNEAAGALAIYVSRNCNEDVRRFRDLIIHNDQASQLKLLILEDNFDREDAKVIRKEIPCVDLENPKPGTFYWYNYPMSFREFEPDGSTPFTGGLYNRFLSIDNPNNSGREIYEISDLEIPYTCDMLETIHVNETGFVIDTPQGVAYPETVTVDFERGVVSLGDVRVVCE